MTGERWIGGAWAALALLCATPAHAHIKLLKPESWLNEDQTGGPQKGSPCGPGNSRPFIGDDMQPAPVSGAVTTFQAGEKVTVEWQETVYHPGYFRISIAPTEAADATSADFPDPALTDPDGCYYDRDAVQTEPHDSVLADGLFMAEAVSGEGRSLKHEITLPDEPCEHCTLQVVQVMEGHGASSCFYFHCADIVIEVAGEGSAGEGSAGEGSAGKPAKPEAKPDASTGSSDSGDSDDDDGGCSVAHTGASSSSLVGWCLLALAARTLTFRAGRSRSRARGRDGCAAGTSRPGRL